MSVWPPATAFVKGDEVRVLRSRYAGLEGEVTFVKPQAKGMYPFEVSFTDGGRAIFEEHELEKK